MSYGSRGQPIFSFNADVTPGHLALTHVPNPFYRHFSLIFNVRPSSPAAAVLFSITDELQKLVYVGVKLSGEQAGRQKVQFFYTEPDSEASYEAASFDVPSLVNSWTRFSLSVIEDQVTFYHGCESEPQVVRFERSPDPMVLDTEAEIFVGQAGKADADRFRVKAHLRLKSVTSSIIKRSSGSNLRCSLLLSKSISVSVVRVTCRS